MTHTEESLIALHKKAHIHRHRAWKSKDPVDIAAYDKIEENFRLAIREVLAELDSCAGQIAEAVDQWDRQARRAEKAEAECERLRRALQWIVSVNAMDYEYVAIAKKALNGEAECAKQRECAEKAEAEVERLKQELVGQAFKFGLAEDGLRKDAERYRWARDQIYYKPPGYDGRKVGRWVWDWDLVSENGSDLDAAIDAAMKEQP